jgi:hypothetical protein
MSSRKQCSNEQPNCEWWKRTFFGPPNSPHHYMCTLPDERYRAECPIIKRAEVEEKLEEMVKVKCCDKCDAYEPFCKDVCPVYKFEYEQLCRKDERDKVLKELIEHYEQVIKNGKGVTFNHSIDYQWMYQGVVVDYLKELRQDGGEL